MPFIEFNSGGANIRAWTEGVPFEDAAQQQVNRASRLPIVEGVAVMPDVHFGIGATVGSVIVTRNAIIPAAVGVDIGCFHGDTKIETVDGKKRKIQDLARRNKPIVVFAFDRNTKKIVVAKATAHKTRTNAELVKVRLDNGEAILCTPDHKFLTRGGSYVEASELKPSTSLMPLYFTQDKDGYLGVRQLNKQTGRLNNKATSESKVHRMVAKAFVPKVKTWDEQHLVVHHKNENKNDNRPANLEWVGRSDHSLHHYEARIAYGTWHFTSDNPQFEKKRKAGIRKLAKTEEGYRMMAERARDNMAEVMEDPDTAAEFREKMAGNGKRGKRYLQQYSASKEGLRKSRAKKDYTCIFCGVRIKSESFNAYHYIRKHRREVYDYLEAQGKKPDTSTHYQPNNHKVVSVKKLKLRSDVYCLNVPEYHNFALAAGVFVHNCGMMAVRTTLTASDLPDSLASLRGQVERDIPHGEGKSRKEKTAGHTGELDGDRRKSWRFYLEEDFKELCEADPDFEKTNHVNHLGSLGGGNHFIELCLDEEQHVWMMLHSGSRGIGNAIGRKYIQFAIDEAEKGNLKLEDKDLAYLSEDSQYFGRYVRAVDWAQRFAMQNRNVMMKAFEAALRKQIPKAFQLTDYAINCHHNYVQYEKGNRYITRKGAVSAKLGEYGIIPGSMGAKSFIVRGLGNEASYNSCSHGAGRVMSRGEAKRVISLEEHVADTAGIECRKDTGVLDESPKAYKDIDAVMAAQKDLVEIVHTLRQVMCVKG